MAQWQVIIELPNGAVITTGLDAPTKFEAELFTLGRFRLAPGLARATEITPPMGRLLQRNARRSAQAS